MGANCLARDEGAEAARTSETPVDGAEPGAAYHGDLDRPDQLGRDHIGPSILPRHCPRHDQVLKLAGRSNPPLRSSFGAWCRGEEIRGQGLFVAVLEDISESRSLSAELAYQAAHDQLTGLANRREFERELNHLLHDSGSSSGRHALGLIDLDQFKVVNDTFGHLAGDALLVRLAERIHHCLRDGDLLARLDGDQ